MKKLLVVLLIIGNMSSFASSTIVEFLDTKGVPSENYGLINVGKYLGAKFITDTVFKLGKSEIFLSSSSYIYFEADKNIAIQNDNVSKAGIRFKGQEVKLLDGSIYIVSEDDKFSYVYYTMDEILFGLGNGNYSGTEYGYGPFRIKDKHDNVLQTVAYLGYSHVSEHKNYVNIYGNGKFVLNNKLISGSGNITFVRKEKPLGMVYRIDCWFMGEKAENCTFELGGKSYNMEISDVIELNI